METMKKKITSFIPFLIWIFCSFIPVYSYSQSIDDIYFTTENYPPYNFEENGKLQGISVELLILMLKKLNAKQTIKDIHLKPWARGYNALLKIPNTCLFSTIRTKQRESLFKWVGPITTTSISLIARKDKNIKINSVKDIYNYKIGVVRDDIGEQLLLKAGIPSENLDRISGINVITQSIKKLNKARFDAWAYDHDVALWTIKKFGFDPDDYQIVYSLQKGDLYYAFHKDSSDLLIQKLQKALDELKTEGEYQKILDRYQRKVTSDLQ